MDKEEIADVINIANQILNLVEQGGVDISHFETWFSTLMEKYNDKDKCLKILDNAVMRFLILHRQKKAQEGYAVSDNVQEEQ
jgi:hypothetical protein